MTLQTPTSAPRLEPVLAAFKRASLSPTAGYRLIKAGKFPRLVKHGRRSFVLAAEVDAWIEALVSGSDAGNTP